jgi:hypothetical protein
MTSSLRETWLGLVRGTGREVSRLPMPQSLWRSMPHATHIQDGRVGHRIRHTRAHGVLLLPLGLSFLICEAGIVSHTWQVVLRSERKNVPSVLSVHYACLVECGRSAPPGQITKGLMIVLCLVPQPGLHSPLNCGLGRLALCHRWHLTLLS